MLSWGARTDVGHRREANEDSLVALPPIFCVADGMGGHSAGDVASAAVVTRLAEHVGESSMSAEAIARSLSLAVEDMAQGAGVTDRGTGTTATGAALGVIAGEAVWIVFNIGDSRVYQLVSGVLEQVTVDHSVVQELVDSGRITREEADVHPQGNVITRAVGFHEAPIPDYRILNVQPGMRILVCSDGLTKELTAYGIRHFLLGNPDPGDAADALVNAALENGGRDNVTVIVLDVVDVVTGDVTDSSVSDAAQ
nr:protein phosphatase 2C domain-containing protein [Leifsonia psychrotolerans]